MPTRCLSRRPRPAQAPSAQAGRRARPAQACVPRRRSSFEPCVQRVHTAGGRPSSLLENLPLSAGAFYVPASGRLVFSPVPPRGCGGAGEKCVDQLTGKLDLGWETTGGVDRAPQRIRTRTAARRQKHERTSTLS